ncbi:sporulation protein YunB [Fictibacillus sp. S7]|uniref:sporulation protein YunB n=1 Tax=Fictibacillus sp. S7 TaxID=2212476 RepID=UPI0013E94B98|nr:sporulation protein YunB [Fictibacillus sp. S7]
MFKKRFRVRRRPFHGPLPFKTVIKYSFLIFAVIVLFSLWFANKAVDPLLMNIAESEMKGIATETVNDSLAESMKRIDLNSLVIVRQASQGGSPTYSFNPDTYNSLITSITKDIQNKLGNKKTKHMPGQENFQSVDYYIPLGALTGNAFFSDIGPKVPVSMSLLGEVEPEVKTKVTDAGINNVYLEIFVHIKMNIQVVIPFATHKEPLETKIKLGDIFIPGSVPDYYGGENKSLPPPAVVPKKNE